MNADGDGQSIRPDHIVARWRGDAERGEPPHLVRFEGFVGDTEDGYVSLYDTDDSSHVIRIQQAAIKAVEPLDPALTTPFGTSLWVDPEGQCLHLVPGGVTPESFLAGAIAEGAYGLLLDESGILRCRKWKSFSRH
jgi:hypothetical protein